MSARRADPTRTATALLAQADHVLDWLAARPPSQWRRPSVLPGWTIGELAVHLETMLAAIGRTLARSTRAKPLAVAEYLGRYAAAAEEVLERDKRSATGRAPDEILAGLYAGREAAARAIADPRPARTVQGGRGPIAPADYLVTRVIEAVVHSDDLSRSLPDVPPVALDRDALRITAQSLADVLAARAPGRSLELRVSPYAAVQAVEGPRHTRGTPPNVVETDPLTWARLAAGRISWSEATKDGSVHASGERADLGPWLPLL